MHPMECCKTLRCFPDTHTSSKACIMLDRQGKPHAREDTTYHSIDRKLKTGQSKYQGRTDCLANTWRRKSSSDDGEVRRVDL